ncbi:MAG TPA: TonB-dependent siderophore receptor [Lysobacter sp.]|nr:TonB-dependent siderophore receptor [Lysobacter sp.]
MSHPGFRAPIARPLCFVAPHSRTSLRTHALSSGLLLALAVGSAHADDLSMDAAAELDAVVVDGQRVPEYAPGATSGATRLSLTPRETPQSISVVTRAQMDDFGLNSVNDVLNNTTGVNVEQVETDRTYYTARGFDIVNFQRDGLGLPFPYGIQDGDLDTALYERVEVLRGANGLMSSTGNPSATVNFVRKRPTEELQGSARVGVGSWDYRRIDLDVSGALNASGSLRGRAVAAWQDNESYLDRYSLEKQVYYGVIEADLGVDTTLTAGASLQKNRPNSPMWGALPLFYSDGTPTDYDESTSTAADWSFWDIDDTRVFVDISHAFGNGWKMTAAFNHDEVEGDSQLFYVYGTPDRETGLGTYAYPSAYNNRFRAQFVDAFASGPLTLGGRDHDVVVGANWAKGDDHEVSWYSNDIGTPLPDLATWGGRYPKPSFDAYSSGADFDYERSSVYATVRWNLADNFKLITGASRTQAETRGASYGTPTNYRETKTTPFAGAIWDLSETYSLYGSYGEIFNPQTQTDVNDRLLKPISGSNAELGMKSEWFAGALNTSFAVFWTRQDNLAEALPFDPNIGRTVYRGVDAESTGYEFDIAGRLTENWQIAGGFTQLRLEDPDGHDTRTYVPRRLLRLSTVVNVPQAQGLKLGASLRWQSEIHRDQGTTATATPIVTHQDAYALLGLMARYSFAGAWDATLNLDNVTNEKYIPSLYWDQGFYGAPRSVSLSIGYRF